VELALLAKLLEPLPPGIGRGAATQAERRARGQVFTPPGSWADPADRARPAGSRLLDPACGDGAFLRAARAVLPAAARFGVERDPRVARAARAATPGATVRVAEALLGRARVPKVDAVIGNPPYVRSIRLRTSDPALWAALRGRSRRRRSASGICTARSWRRASTG
jgi:23S rRNA G2445 N2-methylase RlmL